MNWRRGDSYGAATEAWWSGLHENKIMDYEDGRGQDAMENSSCAGGR